MVDFYVSSGVPGQGASVASAPLRAQFAALQAAFGKLVAYTGNGGKLVVVNSGGTAYEAVSELPSGMIPAAVVQNTRLVSAGTGLTGGGSLAADRTLALDATSPLNADHSAISISAGSGLTGGGTLESTRTLSLDTSSARNADHSAISISAGTGLTGGGTIAATRTLSLDTTNTRNTDHAAVSISAGTGLSGGGTLESTRTLSLDTSSTRNTDHASVTLTASNGLSGGGTIAANRTISLNVNGLTLLGPSDYDGDANFLLDVAGVSYRTQRKSLGLRPVSTTTGTLGLTDMNCMFLNASSTNYTKTIPPNSSVAFPIGVGCTFYNYGGAGGTQTIAPGSGVTLISPTGTFVVGANGGAELRKVATNTWVLNGYLP